MKPHGISIAGLVVLALTVSADARAQSPIARLEALLESSDVDGDGGLTLGEIKGKNPGFLEAAFAKFDRDKDGKLTRKDLAILQKAQDDDAWQTDAIRELVTLDVNADGKVTFQEVTARRPGYPEANFAAHDLDKDGVVSQKDVALAVQRYAPDEAVPEKAQDFAKRLFKADANGDREITFEEATAQFPNLTRERFDRLDRNDDGVVSRLDRDGASKGMKKKKP